MPLAYARRLTGRERFADSNRQLGAVLAFVAGATNAGAYLAVNQYTSHMTGLLSSAADNLVLGRMELVFSAAGAMLFFLLGAATSAILVNYARRRHLHSEFAFPLLFEALLLLCFGLLGSRLSAMPGVPGLFVSVTVSLLCYMMGLQNAVITKLSSAEIRTTHVTGLITDIGIELGKFLYWNRRTSAESPVLADRGRLVVLLSLLLSFFGGGIFGALGFKYLGYLLTIPLALLLVLLAGVQAVDDVRNFLLRRVKPLF